MSDVKLLSGLKTYALRIKSAKYILSKDPKELSFLKFQKGLGTKFQSSKYHKNCLEFELKTYSIN